MTDVGGFADVLRAIEGRIGDDMSEKDVENAFLNENFYAKLGYEGAGHDLRSEWSLPDNRRPDYVTLDANESVTAVYEFKTSGEELEPHTDQLFHYVDQLKADYGVLTNGERLVLYRRGNEAAPLLDVSLSTVTGTDARDLYSALEKPEWDITDPESVNEFLSGLDPVALDGELGRDHFFDTFRLEEGSPFADLVTASMDLLTELRDEQNKKFVEGAYDFWETSYASVPDDVPDSWEPFIGDDHSLIDFMFCLESGHALLSRLLLAKAADDYDFFPNPVMERFFSEIQGFGDEIEVDVYPAGASDFLDKMHRELVESLFEDDIFVWWIDGYGEAINSLHSSSSSRFRDIIQGKTEVTAINQATKERFSRAVAHVLYSIMKFDFSTVEGDPLGDLYQQYFDPETRKALGEFYTPQPVIDYIMDGVGYDTGISNDRLIDPSCGSGTFLVEAVERYLDDVRRYNDNPDWDTHLTELCTRPHIVGLDIHPFAVLMAQIRFMVTILPEYREAKRENPDFTIRRLPIFRTDTLRNERESTGEDIGEDGSRQMTFDAMTEDSRDVRIPVPLPVEAKEGEETEQDSDFLVRRVRMPLFDTIQLETGVSNFGEYFAALQGVLDVVKYHMGEGLWEYRGGLQEGINRYTTREYEGVDEFFAPYVDDMLETVRYLKDEHNDGRLFKMFEDTVLSLVVKNYIEYDFVVGNPPYVRKENIPSAYKNSTLKTQYPDIYSGNADLSVYFIKRGIDFLTKGGSLGYITSSRFTSTAYGSGLRKTLTSNTTITEFSNFEMSNFFDDATAYPAVLIAKNKEPDDDYDINVVYGRKRPSDSEVGRILQEMREKMNQEGTHTTKYYSAYKTKFSDLNEREWRFTPFEANRIFRDLQSKADYELSEVTKEISAGIKTGRNTVFIITPEKANELDIEEQVLRPIYRGSDIERYQMGQPEEFLIYTHGVDIEEYPNVYEYLESNKQSLQTRKDATFKNKGKKWYELNIPHSEDVMESDKIICPEMTTQNNYALDKNGSYILNKVFFARTNDKFDGDLEYLLGLLNTSTLEFFLKQTSSPLQNGYYQYLTRYQERLPVKMGDDTEQQVVRQVTKIRKAIDLQNQVETFPERYMNEYNAETEYITYEWQTRRYPVNAEMVTRDDGTFAVEAGRSDSITAPQIDSEKRAEYVHAAVDGRNVKSGEEMTIPIPRRDEDVATLLSELREDEQTVAETDIDELEAEIDQAVYDLFDLTEDEQEVIEEYLTIF